tara:strand:- start:88 stop:1527 length:1440 start_codon:yes stop_codon:yes gene_type:complete
MCGILGIVGVNEKEDVYNELICGLTTLQHRGQDSAGLVTFDRTFHLEKKLGVASEVFKQNDLDSCRGAWGLGHTRYATQGETRLMDAQPFTLNHPYGIAMVHNGNITNFEQLRENLAQDHRYLIETSNDLEFLLYTFGLELEKTGMFRVTPESVFQAVEGVQRKVQGAYATIALIAGQGMVAFTDPCGIRPLLLGRKDTETGPAYAFASETKCFDYLGYTPIHQLGAGEAIFIDANKKIHTHSGVSKRQAFCVFEYIYLSQADTSFHGRLVASDREKLGHVIAKRFQERGFDPDIVIDVPSSGYFFAQGLAEALGIPYKKGLIKNNQAKRSFISPTQALRKKIVHQKHNPLKTVIQGKKVAVVDDSIVRGTTSKHICDLIRRAGAEAVYFVSGAPAIKHPCIYGVDMPDPGEMVAAIRTEEEVAEFMGADAVVYPSLEDMRSLYQGIGICDACFSGEYPSNVSEETLEAIRQEKVLSCR